MNPIFRFFSSLRLTVVLLAFSIVLVFFGTLDQSRWGIHETQQLYFESFFVLTPVLALLDLMANRVFNPNLAWFVIPLPGGFLLGGLLVVNLLCAHFRYFKASWRKTGIFLIHLGVVLLLISGFLVAFMQEESQMRLDEKGAPVNFSTDFRNNELVLIHRAEEGRQRVTTIPQSLLAEGGVIELPELPFSLRVEYYAANAGAALAPQLLKHYEKLLTNPQLPPAQQEAVRAAVSDMRSGNGLVFGEEGRTLVARGKLPLKGFASNMGGVIQEQPMRFGTNEVNIPAAVISVLDAAGEPLSTWVLSSGFGPGIPAQTFSYEGTEYEIKLRFLRHYFPFWMQLQDFSHDKYPGTEIAMNFSSDLILKNPETGDDRRVLIYMNHPLRYEGFTFFQQSFDNEDTTTILMVVRNPAWTLPYLAVALVGLGMTLHFGLSLWNFASRQQKRKGTAHA